MEEEIKCSECLCNINNINRFYTVQYKKDVHLETQIKTNCRQCFKTFLNKVSLEKIEFIITEKDNSKTVYPVTETTTLKEIFSILI